MLIIEQKFVSKVGKLTDFLYNLANEYIILNGLKVNDKALRIACNTLAINYNNYISKGCMNFYTYFHKQYYTGKVRVKNGMLLNKISNNAFKAIMHALEEAGLISIVKGGLASKQEIADGCEKHKKSFVSISDRFRYTIKELTGETNIIVDLYSENVEVRGLNVDIKSINCTEFDNKLEKVDKINERTMDHTFTLPNEDIAFFRFHRVFNDDLTRGGRLYTSYGLIQGLNSHERLQCKIDGLEVVEVDLKASHISILATINKYKIESDPYDVYDKVKDVYPMFTFKQIREVSKKLLLIYLNCDADRARTFPALYKDKEVREIIGKHKVSFVKLLDELLIKNNKVFAVDKYCSGLYLQYLESDVIVGAVSELLTKGVGCVPIHDSILLPREHEDLAIRLLEKNWKRVFTNTTNFKFEVKRLKEEEI